MVEISGVNAGSIRSVRVFRGAGTGDQRACSTTTHWQEQGTQTAAPLVNVMVTSYVRSPQRGGIILTGTRSDGKVQVRASLIGLRGGTAYRIVGSTAPCGTAHTGSKRVYAVPFTTLGDTGTHEIGHWVSVVADADRPTSALRSIRVIKDFGAGNQVEACHGIIAILIGL
jgi:hypothetical protein